MRKRKTTPFLGVGRRLCFTPWLWTSGNAEISSARKECAELPFRSFASVTPEGYKVSVEAVFRPFHDWKIATATLYDLLSRFEPNPSFYRSYNRSASAVGHEMVEQVIAGPSAGDELTLTPAGEYVLREAALLLLLMYCLADDPTMPWSLTPWQEAFLRRLDELDAPDRKIWLQEMRRTCKNVGPDFEPPASFVEALEAAEEAENEKA